jgi:hypothetical protein
MAADASLKDRAARGAKEESEKSKVRQTAIRLRPHSKLHFVSHIPGAQYTTFPDALSLSRAEWFCIADARKQRLARAANISMQRDYGERCVADTETAGAAEDQRRKSDRRHFRLFARCSLKICGSR